MKIGIIGATGKAGNHVLNEALNRGLDVTAIVRNKEKLQDVSIPVIEKDVYDLTGDDLQSFDVVVNAFGAPLGEEKAHVEVGQKLIQALEDTDSRLIVVGGAGSLFVDKEKKMTVMETPEFPTEFAPTALGQSKNLQDLQQTQNLKWTFISPSAYFDPTGARTGDYTKGEDHLLVNSQNESYISYADYAIALVDEIENADHIRQRFTVVGEK